MGSKEKKKKKKPIKDHNWEATQESFSMSEHLALSL